MVYALFIVLVCIMGGLMVVASNPSPYFGAVGLVFSAVFSCGLLVELGGSFVSLVLFLIYLGGMLVVFAYSVALASDQYPETLGTWSVGVYSISYIFLVVVVWGVFIEGKLYGLSGFIGEDSHGLSSLRVDFSGVSLLYSVGGGGLLICGWGLLLTLFVVLELTRGLARGGLRAI
uniref:NADH-ubiquinone oxidoreductase chain 6 n=1 Tax=Plica plica TaxID=179265 RepID=C4T8B2_9SAUR|nr:NADH dehydrogenase subunit 6 [Plica plica]